MAAVGKIASREEPMVVELEVAEKIRNYPNKVNTALSYSLKIQMEINLSYRFSNNFLISFYYPS